jgi:hypothetical protein
MSYTLLARTTTPSAATLRVAAKLGLQQFSAVSMESETLTSRWSQNFYSFPLVRVFSTSPTAHVTLVDNQARLVHQTGDFKTATSFAALRALDMEVVCKIQAELKGIDANSDGR